jgi:hypothetical protein
MMYAITAVLLVAGMLLLAARLRHWRRQRLLRGCIEKHGDHFGRMIANARIGIGMTSEMLTEAWGEPDKTDGKVIREDYYKVVYHYGAQPDRKEFKYRITLVNDKITEIRED